ncbi:hypothetical protein [Pontiella sp.]|uniref:hypothetical protein n=1 Tax=Pontiella sp. TaxID=2837462 RepID=UPI003561B821
MKPLITALLCAVALGAHAQFNTMEPRAFSNAEGKTLTDRIVKYDSETETVTFEKNGKIPLDTFSEADRKYILHWAQVEGFRSSMRFKLEVDKSSWASMKHEQNVTPYYIDAVQIPGKRTPNHTIIELEDYEEYTAVYLEAEGFEIKIRNQNFFPIENITVESKIFYEQEQYILPDSLFLSSENEYTDSVVTNRFRFLSETIPIIIPREEVFLNSEAAIIVDQQVERSSLVSTSNNEDDSDDDSDDGTESVEGFGEWDDHGRRRKGRVLGVWFRVGIVGLDGEMVWRDIASPNSIMDKWESFETAGLPEPKETEADQPAQS